MNNRTKRIITSTVIIAVLVVVCVVGNIISDTHLPDKLSPGAYRAIFFDVGEADCILYHGEDAVILTDAPENETEQAIGYMERMGIKQIDYFIITHYDKDHVGDALKIIKKFKPLHILMPEPVKSKINVYNEIVKITNDKQRITAKTGQRYETGGVVIDILAPNGIGDESNDTCIVCKLTYKETSLLLCSDISADEEKVILSKYGDNIKSDVLKVAHHGSRYSSTDAFICTVSPEYAVISCGPNTYGHPNTDVIKRLKAINAEVFITQQKGVIIFDFFEDHVAVVK